MELTVVYVYEKDCHKRKRLEGIMAIEWSVIISHQSTSISMVGYHKPSVNINKYELVNEVPRIEDD